MTSDNGQLAQYQSLLDLISAAQKLSPEEEEQKRQLERLRKEAKDLYKERASRSEWLSLAETVGNALTKIGAAQAGIRAGVPVSTELFAKPTDWDAKIEGYRRDYLTEVAELGGQERALAEGPKARAEVAGVVGRAALEAETRPLPRPFPSQQAQYETPGGEPLSYDPNTDEYKIIGTGKKFTGIPRQRYDVGRGFRPPVGADEAAPESPKQAFDALPAEGKKDVQRASKDLAVETKSIKESLENLSGIDIAVDNAVKNPVSAAQLGVRVAKALGEVGNLSQSDVTRYVERKGLPQKYADLYQEMRSGTITLEKAADVKEALAIFRQALTERIPERALEKATIIGTRYGIEPTLLVPSISAFGAKGPAEPPMTEEDKQAIKFIEDNPDDPRTPGIRKKLRAKGLVK